MLVPAATSMGILCSSSQRMTPTCAMPRALPPPNATPTVRRDARPATRGEVESSGPSVPVLVLAARWSGAAHDTPHMIVVHNPAIRIQSLRIVRHTFRVWPSWPSHLDGEVQRENAEGLPSGHGW